MSAGHRAWGFEFEFNSDDAMLAEAVAYCFGDLPSCQDAAASFQVATRHVAGRVVYDLALRGPDGAARSCGEGIGRDKVLTLLAWEVNGRARASRGDATVLHAAVIGGTGGAVAVCGQSCSGKSTLAAAAARRGWTHLSDDLALVALHPAGSAAAPPYVVHPYARPLMVRAASRNLVEVPAPPPGLEEFFTDDVFVPASALGAHLVADPQPLRALVFLDPAGGGAPGGTVSRADTLYRLTMHSATLQHRGADGFDDLRRLAEAVPGRTLHRSELDSMLAELAPLVGH